MNKSVLKWKGFNFTSTVLSGIPTQVADQDKVCIIHYFLNKIIFTVLKKKKFKNRVILVIIVILYVTYMWWVMPFSCTTCDLKYF